ncbi:MAG: hypothetical protein CVU06_09535, partial [Bacteroidetes bacterium HGW-Bacteroidetes-22]
MLIALLLTYMKLHGRIPFPGFLLLLLLMILPGNGYVYAQHSPTGTSVESAPQVTQGFTRFEATPLASKKLPNAVNETSGLIWFRGAWWTHNDSGGKPEIYRLSKSG